MSSSAAARTGRAILHHPLYRSLGATRLIVALLVAATLTAYFGVGDFNFVNLDDDAYVEHQPMVNRGLRSAAVAWAFTASHSGTWHPLASLSHALDCELFGVNPGPMHRINLLIHALNVVLVFHVWRAVFGGMWRAALVAALFALHPLNVESVAWISERKNVLSTFFWLLGIGAYAHYARRPSLARYGGVALAFGLGLLTKPMLVTFPCVLLLLDFWPLARWPKLGASRLVKEKLPLFAITIAVCFITLAAQAHTGATDYGKRFGFFDRAGNAVVSYVRYLEKMLWPESLSVFYPHPGAWPVATVAGAAALLASVTALAWWQRRDRPWLVFGWLWFLGTLVPVIGFVQSGAQAMADRYSYVPLLGIFTIVAWAAAEFTTRHGRLRPLVAGSIVAALCCLGFLTHRQTKAWKDSISLYRHSIAVGEDNATVRYLLGVALHAAGRPIDEVAAQWQRALEIRPDYINARTQLASIALQQRRFDEARRLFEQNLKYEPRNAALRYNLAMIATWESKTDEVIRHLRETIDLDPKSAGAHRQLAQVYIQQRKLAEARAHYEAAVRADRWNPTWLTEYGTLLANLGELQQARRHLNRAIWIDPQNQLAKENLLAVDQLMQRKS